MVSSVEPGAGGPPTHGTDGDSPPSYDEATEPPPSYQSLFGKIQDAIGCTILIGLVMAIPIAMIVLGVKYKNQCPVEKKIPIYLIVVGAVGVFRILISLGQRAKQSDNQDEEKQKRKRPVESILDCFLFVWFICGNVWIYQNYEPSYEVGDPGYCNKTLYLFAFWITTSTYILVGVLCCYFCVVGICAAATGCFDDILKAPTD